MKREHFYLVSLLPLFVSLVLSLISGEFNSVCLGFGLLFALPAALIEWITNEQSSSKKANRLASSQRRQKRIRSARGSHTQADIRRIYRRQGGRCKYCDIEVGNVYHVDHVIPLSRGGSNDSGNLAIACPQCNLSKGSKKLHEWKQRPPKVRRSFWASLIGN